MKRRVEGVGEFTTDIEVKGSVIRSLNIRGDYFLVGDIDNWLIGRLVGVEYTPEAVEAAIAHIDVSKIIHNLENKELTKILFQP